MKRNGVLGLVIMLAAGFICGPAAAQVSVTPTVKPTPIGQLIVVNNGPIDQNDPHISGNLVVYSNTDATNSTIHYFDLASLTDKAIPNSGTNPRDFLSDVRGTTIVFTRMTPGQSAIFSFDTASGLLTEIAPQAGSVRREAQIGDQTIAWQDFGFSNSATVADIVVYDRQSGTTTRLANDSALNQWPGISPDGRVIVWGKCPTISSPCTTWLATLSNATWTAQQVSSQVETQAATHPDTDGTIVAYSANSGSGDQLLWQPVSGGAEQILNLQGGQGSTPSISAGLIAFSYLPANASSHEIALYDVANNVFYNLTGDIGAQPGADKQLNDISVTPDGQVRVVWEVQQTDLNIYAYTFSLSPLKYTLTDLGPMQISAAPSGATALNGSGQVTGFFFDSSFGANRAFLWNNDTLSEFGTLGGAASFGYGINNAGQVVGTSDLSASGGNMERAFLWQNGAMGNLGDPNPDPSNYSVAFGINSAGDVVGYEVGTDTYIRPIIWKGGTPVGATLLTPLACPYVVCQGEALAVNDLGQAAGWSIVSGGTYHPVMWDSTGQPTDIGTLGGTSYYNQANGINKNGVVVGLSQFDPSTVHAFVWHGGTPQDLGTIPGLDPIYSNLSDNCSSAWGINSKGDIVGISGYGTNTVVLGGGGRAFLNTGGVMYDLTSLLVPGTNWKLEAAWAINDNGQIVGVGFNPSGIEHGYLLTPSTAPTTTTLTPSVNPSVFGQQVSITTSVSPTSSSSFTPGGNVTFSDGSNALETVDLTSGMAILNTSALTVGSHTITASYSGDANFNSSSSAALSQTVNQGTTTTTVSASSSPGITGQPVTFTAIVTPVAPSSGTPGATVTFLDGTTTLAPPVTLTGGQAAFTTSSLTSGAHSITAVYNGDGNFLASTSSTFAEVINQAIPTITWPTPAAILYGTPLSSTQLDATASVAGTFAYTPAASAVLSVGNQTLSVTFTPTDTTDYTTATATVTLVVNPGPPTITSPASGSSTTISSVTITGTGIPGASVTILDGTVPVATSSADSAGNFSASLTLAIGSHTLTATQTVNGLTSAASAAVNLSVIALPPAVITDNETITVTDTSSFPDVFDPESVKVTDQVTVYAFFPIALSPAPPLFSAVQNRPYSSVTFSATGGYQGLTLSETGVIPGMMFSINGPTMVFSGTPTEAGSFPFTVTATDSVGNTLSLNYSLAVAASCAVINVIPSGSLGAVTVGSPFSQTFSASGGIGTITWSESGVLSTGMSFSTGVLSGIPTLPGAFAITVSASDQNGCQGSANVSLLVVPPPAVITDNETVTVTDTPSFSDIYDAEQITVTDQITIHITNSTVTSISAPGVTYGTPAAATVSVTSPAASVTGNVTLSVDGGTQTSMGLSNGSATFNLGLLNAGPHSLAANFAAQDPFVASNATSTLTVSRAIPVLTWPVPAPITYGIALSGTQLNATASVPGTFTYSPAANTVLGVGRPTLSVTFTPTDTTDYTSASATVTLVVIQQATTTTLNSSANPSNVGQTVTFTATVTGTSLSGTVQFNDGTTSLGPAVTLSGGSAQLMTSSLALGSHSITALYSGDANHSASTSAALLQAVNSGSALTVSPSSLAFNSQLLLKSLPQSVTVANTGTAPVIVNRVALSGPDSGEFDAQSNCPAPPASLPVNANCSVAITFSPKYSTAATANLLVFYNGGIKTNQIVALTGTVPVITVSPLLVQFTRPNGLLQTVTVTNTGTGPAVIKGLSFYGILPRIGGPTPFAVSNSTCPTSPRPLLAGGSCTITIIYSIPKLSRPPYNALLELTSGTSIAYAYADLWAN